MLDKPTLNEDEDVMCVAAAEPAPEGAVGRPRAGRSGLSGDARQAEQRAADHGALRLEGEQHKPFTDDRLRRSAGSRREAHPRRLRVPLLAALPDALSAPFSSPSIPLPIPFLLLFLLLFPFLFPLVTQNITLLVPFPFLCIRFRFIVPLFHCLFAQPKLPKRRGLWRIVSIRECCQPSSFSTRWAAGRV